MSLPENTYHFKSIATIESPYKEKFAIPRQPNLANAAVGKVLLTGEANSPEVVRDIEQFSHLWLVFVFSATQEQGWKPLVRPPRLGGNSKTGVFASRSTFRPNPIGMSVVKLERVETKNKQTILHVSGLDLLHGTPILDIKPYVPYSDAIDSAEAGFANDAPQCKVSVQFSKQAQTQLSLFEQKYPQFTLLIEQVLQQDPRPAYKHNTEDTKVYGMSLFDVNIQWHFTSITHIEVIAITQRSAISKSE